MEKDIWSILREHYPNLTKSEKKLVDCILGLKDEAQYFSITSLAEQCKIGESTISRFCRNIGLDRYGELKLMIAKASMKNISSDIVSNKSNESFINRAKSLYSEEVMSIKNTLKILDENMIKKAVKILSSAKTVYCFGQGSSGNIASDAFIRFSSISNKFSHVRDSHIQAIKASLATKNDAILYFCYSGSTKEVLDIQAICKATKTPFILVTNFEKSPAGKSADVCLLCSSRESPLDSGSIPAKMAQLFLIDVLYSEYININDKSISKKELTAYAISKKI